MTVVNDFYMTLGIVDKEANRIGLERLARLVEELQKEPGGPYSQSVVARRMGMGQSHLSRLLNGQRGGVGLKVVGRIADKLGLDMEYFTAREEPISYREYLRTGAAKGLAHPSLEQFLCSSMSDGISKAHEEELREERPPDGDPGVEYYVHLYSALKARDRHHETLRAAANVHPEWQAALTRNEEIEGPMAPEVARKMRALNHDVPVHENADLDAYASEKRARFEQMLAVTTPGALQSAKGPRKR